MNDNFDNILTKKIEESFQELEVPYEAEHWNAIRTKIESPAGYSILSSTIMKIAAVLLVGIVLSLYYFAIPEKEMPISNYEEPPSIIEQNPPELSPVEPQQIPDNNKALSNNNAKVVQTDDEGGDMTLVNSTITKAEIQGSSIYNKAIPMVSVIEDTSTLITEKLVRVEPPRENPVIVRKSHLNRIEHEMGILAASNVGFSKAENGAPVGYSAGFVSAFSITRKVSVSSGLVVSHQDLQVEDTGSEITLESSLNESQELTQAKLLALDIPVNFQYHFNKSGKTRSFLSIGFSSLFYLQQEFNFTTRQVTEEVLVSEDGTITTFRNISEQQNSSSQPAFSRFDAASLLNISVGFQHTLSPTSEIVFEPYVKYPLGSLTDQNVRFGYGGIQLRIKF